MVDPNLSGVGEVVEERGRRWRCADAGEHGQSGRPPLEVWTLGKELGRRRARAPWPLAAGGSTDAGAQEHLGHGRAGSRPTAPQGRK